MNVNDRRKAIDTALALLALKRDIPAPIREAVGALVEEVRDLRAAVEELSDRTAGLIARAPVPPPKG